MAHHQGATEEKMKYFHVVWDAILPESSGSRKLQGECDVEIEGYPSRLMVQFCVAKDTNLVGYEKFIRIVGMDELSKERAIAWNPKH
jgi:hypothetical protein